MSEPEQQAQLAPEQRIAAAISYDDKCIGLVGYRLTDEQVEKIVRVVLTAARVAGCPTMRIKEARHEWAEVFSGNSSGDWVRLGEAEAKLDALAARVGCPEAALARRVGDKDPT